MPVIALDTNILVRFITQDDARQTAAVNALIQSTEAFFIPDLVLAETVWVLRRGYRWSRRDVHQALEILLSTTNVQFEDERAVLHATTAYAGRGDWADHCIQSKAQARGCAALATFDASLIQSYPGFARVP